MKASSLIHASLRCWRELAGKMMPKIIKVRMNPVSVRRNGHERDACQKCTEDYEGSLVISSTESQKNPKQVIY